MKYRDAWFHWCGRSGVPEFVARRVWNYAKTMQRAAEVDCSIRDEEFRTYWKKRGDAARAAILANIEKNCADKVRAQFQGDPRGCIVALLLVDDPQGRGMSCPCGGFSAREWERMERADEFRSRAKVTN